GRGLHAEEAGEEREERAREEGDARLDAALEPPPVADEADQAHDGDADEERVDGEQLVLTGEEGHGTLADVASDARHGLVALGGRVYLEVQDGGDDERDGAHGDGIDENGIHVPLASAMKLGAGNSPDPAPRQALAPFSDADGLIGGAILA